MNIFFPKYEILGLDWGHVNFTRLRVLVLELWHLCQLWLLLNT